MNYYIKLAAGVFFVVLLLNACTPEEKFSDVPSIDYQGFSKNKSVNGKDSFLVITMNFRDGDGDIGLTDQDSFPPFSYGSAYFYNLLADFYSIENGVPTKLNSMFFFDTLYKDTVQYHQRLKNLTPTGRNKSIKGKIELLTPFSLLDLSTNHPDSVYFDITLIDRKLNSSNVIRTPVITLDL